MTVTRANLEAILIKRVGAWFTAAGLDGTTVNGTNADLNDPIAQALSYAGYTVANITSVADSDVDDVTSADVPIVLDLAELRALETVQQAGETVAVSGLGYSIKSDTTIADAIKRLSARIAQRYGVGAGGLMTGGSLTLNIAETGVTETE